MKKSFFLGLVLWIGIHSLVSGQEYKAYLKSYDWSKDGVYADLTPEEKALPDLIVKYSNIMEYVYESKVLYLYGMEHRITYVNSDESIKRSSVISLFGKDIITVKARSIAPDGKVTEMDKNNIKEVKSGISDTGKKTFAIDGVQKGSQVEWFVVIKLRPTNVGACYLQFSAPIKEAYFNLITANNLKFAFKEYNNCPKVRDTVVNGRIVYYAEMHDVPALPNEKFAFPSKNRARIEYRFFTNTSEFAVNSNVNTWEYFASFYRKELSDLSNKDLKLTRKIYPELQLDASASLVQKIRTVENYVKTKYIIKINGLPETSSVKFVLQNHYGNLIGILKLYKALFQVAGVNAQICVTSSRSDLEFDRNFPSSRYLGYFLFYFPETMKYIAPMATSFRYPMIPSIYTNTYGLNIEDGTPEGSDICFIPPLDYKTNHQALNIDISFYWL